LKSVVPEARSVTAVVFDLGGVLIDWNPRHLYRKLFDDEDAMEEFLATVCTMAWNDELDRGLPFAEGVARLTAEHPAHAALIDAYHRRWVEMIAGPIADAVDVAAELRARAMPLYALSNWSRETFSLVRHQFPFLGWFAGILLSSDVGVTKPDARIFAELCSRFDLEPASTLFIDDNPPNVDGARAAGLVGVRFQSAATLRGDLGRLGVLESG
jgi:2-haloacid dehalogenase